MTGRKKDRRFVIEDERGKAALADGVILEGCCAQWRYTCWVIA